MVVSREELRCWGQEAGSLVLPQLEIVLNSLQRSNLLHEPLVHLCVEQTRQCQCHSLLHTLHSLLRYRHLLGKVWLALEVVCPLWTVC